MTLYVLYFQTRRSTSGIFAGKQGLITLRDLFRWGERYKNASARDTKFYDWDQHLADEGNFSRWSPAFWLFLHFSAFCFFALLLGYLLLAGRVRKPEETEIISNVIKKHLKRVISPERLFSFDKADSSCITHPVLHQFGNFKTLPTQFQHVVWTFNMRRLAILVGQALRFHEPILLVGDTGYMWSLHLYLLLISYCVH